MTPEAFMNAISKLSSLIGINCGGNVYVPCSQLQVQGTQLTEGWSTEQLEALASAVTSKFRNSEPRLYNYVVTYQPANRGFLAVRMSMHFVG